MEYKELNHRRVLELLPDRQPQSHKGAFGKVLLLCGSRGYTGAAYLAAMGALRCGAGLVYLGVPESIYTIEACKLNEAIVFPLPDVDGKLSCNAAPEIISLFPRMDAVCIGCGLGQSEGTMAVVEAVMKYAPCPVVLDADGINLVSRHKSILREREGVTIVTPHEGELARFEETLPKDREAGAEAFAQKYGCILLRKGHRTLITDGQRGYRNLTGNPGMAVGGSGDLLSGMIAALLGQGIPGLEAAACGAWLHGAAGDLCAVQMGQYAMLPTDMLHCLSRLLK